MTLLSARQDFVQRTLAALGGIWKRLVFTAGLRTNTGEYEHWGLERVHGAVESRSAIALAHLDLIGELVTTPIAEVVEGVTELDAVHHLDPDAVCPPNLDRCLQRHVEFVLEATQLILAAQSRRGGRAA
jgi:hypothetical protein